MEQQVTKQAIGRPLLFKSAEELEKVIGEYFDYCDNRIRTIYSEKAGEEIAINVPAPYTMSGLARRLGVDRQTLINYGKKEEFFGTVQKARQRVEEDVENRLMETRNEKGAMFSLKNNFKWKEEQPTGNIYADKVLVIPSSLMAKYGINS